MPTASKHALLPKSVNMTTNIQNFLFVSVYRVCTNVKNAYSVTKITQYSFDMRCLSTGAAVFYRNVCDIRFILVPAPSYH